MSAAEPVVDARDVARFLEGHRFAVVGARAAPGVGPVDGACPLRFLEPVGGVHRLHRAVRRARHSLVDATSDDT